jgi:hypothetical protein
MADYPFLDPTNTELTTPSDDGGFPAQEPGPDTTRYYVKWSGLKTILEAGGSHALQISGSQVVESITQASHGFSAGQPVGHNGSNWVLADASIGQTPCHALVVNVVNANTFEVAITGIHTLTTHGLTLGQNYLSVTAGQLSPNAAGPGNVQQLVLVAIDANTVLLNIGDPRI